jgi:hypothetical protein
MIAVVVEVDLVFELFVVLLERDGFHIGSDVRMEQYLLLYSELGAEKQRNPPANHKSEPMKSLDKLVQLF